MVFWQVVVLSEKLGYDVRKNKRVKLRLKKWTQKLFISHERTLFSQKAKAREESKSKRERVRESERERRCHTLDGIFTQRWTIGKTLT